MRHAYAKSFEGWLINPETAPKALAEIFCDLMADEQAEFFNMVRHLSDQWSGPATQQWRSMQDHIEPAAREMLKDMFDHTDKSGATELSAIPVLEPVTEKVRELNPDAWK